MQMGEVHMTDYVCEQEPQKLRAKHMKTTVDYIVCRHKYCKWLGY